MTDAPGHPLLLRNGRLLDPVTGIYAEGDLLAVDGRIAEVWEYTDTDYAYGIWGEFDKSAVGH